MQTRLPYKGQHNCTVIGTCELQVSEGVVLCLDVVSTPEPPEPWASLTFCQGVDNQMGELYSISQMLRKREGGVIDSEIRQSMT